MVNDGQYMVNGLLDGFPFRHGGTPSHNPYTELWDFPENKPTIFLDTR